MTRLVLLTETPHRERRRSAGLESPRLAGLTSGLWNIRSPQVTDSLGRFSPDVRQMSVCSSNRVATCSGRAAYLDGHFTPGKQCSYQRRTGGYQGACKA